MPRSAKKPAMPVNTGDWVWVRAKVTRTAPGETGDLEHVTVNLSNGHLETLRYNPDNIKPGDTEHTW